MSSANFQVITSSSQFKDILSVDLNRVSLINFWAPWAEPCKQMNEFVTELAKKHPELLVLQVRALFLITSEFRPTDLINILVVVLVVGIGRGGRTGGNFRLI